MQILIYSLLCGMEQTILFLPHQAERHLVLTARTARQQLIIGTILAGTISKMRKGFTYIELILYVAIVIIVLAALVPFAWNVIEGGVKSTTEQEVFSNAQYISERLKYEIRNASGINSVTPTQISLSVASSSANPTVISLSSGNLTITQGSGSAQLLNSQNTTISSLNFTNYTSADTKTKNIQFIFTLAAKYAGAGLRQEYNESTIIEGAAEIRSN
jgi:type II secretory pathway pseudopilin PulG